ncbi:hypothetical protein ACFQZS_14125 [Mucilaginibacter calamicampi]|uniref:Uncharacterized protein n=1 Tax=Mucilaginibacter calamicampi TaxID=1302352 RepID=A0ABW2YXU2_9SPHI
MTAQEFEALDLNSQANLVWEGEFIGTRVVDDVYIQRYKLTDFEVDVYYDPMNNKIIRIYRNSKRQAD